MYELTDKPIISLDTGALVMGRGDDPASPLTLLLPMIFALVISMMLIPLMVRLAPVLGLMDRPDQRKVHAIQVPRVGGFGIFFGALIPLLLFLPVDHELTAFLAGAMILFVFGVLDDGLELGHYAKFAGQFIAVTTVVYWGDVYVFHFPFLQDGVISEPVGKLFTVFAMVGMVNAINHSDGLDGLAGGEALLSLCGIAWLAFVSGGTVVAFVALSLAGGLLGFMRFNTHPAVIFMGDGGSQFIGYALGFLAVMLTQRVNTALSAALPVLLLGLPIADIIGVFVQRMYKGMNWFRATRNHIHHRLLDLGFFHHQSVVIIYSIQSLLVLCAVMLPYESDMLIVGIYLAVTSAVFLLLHLVERKEWQVNTVMPDATGADISDTATLGRIFRAVSFWVLAVGLSAFLLGGSLLATTVPPDFVLFSGFLFVLVLVRLTVPVMERFIPLRAPCYMSIAFIVYLANTYQPGWMAGTDPVTYIFFAVMMLAIAVAIRFSGSGNFRLTPTDFLVIMVVSSLAVLSVRGLIDSLMTAIVLKTIVLFYASELVLSRKWSRWNLFTVATLVSLAVVCIRGFGLPVASM